MQKPGFVAQVLGHPLICLVITAFAGMALYRWWVLENMPGLVAIMMAVFAFRSLQTAKQVADFKAWQRQWEAMQGEGGGRSPLTLWRKTFNLSFALVVVMGVVLWNRAWGDDTVEVIAAAGFAGGAVLFVTISLWKLVQLLRSRSHSDARPKRSKKAAPVSQCLPAARSAPSAVEAFRALPDYARELIAQSLPQ